MMGVVFLGLTLLSACGGRWIDDSSNFERIFGFDKPQGVEVLHSYYWKSSHWTTEYSYFIALRASQKFVTGLTSAKLMDQASLTGTAIGSCGNERPSWFLPKSITAYEAWVPKGGGDYRVFRDKGDGTLFVCDTRL
jgi:hypothetical protein